MQDCAVTALPLILLVDPEPDAVFELQSAVAERAISHVCCDFVTARHLLAELTPQLLVANARLEAYNGLHLVYIAKGHQLPTRCVIYSRHEDWFLVHEVQSAGAFFESESRLKYKIAGYLTSRLPAVDRRNPFAHDRRGHPRGGRRPSDEPRPLLAG